MVCPLVSPCLPLSPLVSPCLPLSPIVLVSLVSQLVYQFVFFLFPFVGWYVRLPEA